MIRYLCFLYTTFAKILAPCDNIHQNILEPLYEISKDMTNMGFRLDLNKNYATGIVCQEITNDYYGITVRNYKTKTTDIFISHNLLFYKNTLYNVLYHEVLHAYGLDHNNYPGLMNYSIKLDIYNSIVEDSQKIYPSYYDIQYLIYMYWFY